jgi:3-hydroxymyristoyl/3-hydroxydecanoyl-(acyl carrier protein) dehydratase
MSPLATDNWFSVNRIIKHDENTFCGEVCAEEDSPWYLGHFPGDPVLPGIAQLSIVKEVITQAAGDRISVKAIRRVRFRQIIRPNDNMEIRIVAVPEEKNTYKFKILTKDEVACSGTVCIGPAQ